MSEPPYFPDPAGAVERIDDLLEREEFERLARYYDLAGSDFEDEDVARREWFESGGRPVADPRGRTGPHHPFPRGATYDGHEVEGDVSRVTVEVDPALVDPEGGPRERTFFLIRHEGGWQLLAPDDGRIEP